MEKRERKPNGFWTKEECYRAARECGSRNEFKKKYGSGYSAAHRNNWLYDYDWFEEKKKPNGYWTKEECYRAARECKTRTEFAKKCGSGYATACKNNWLREYFWFEEKHKPNGYWTKEKCYEAACECKTRSEFAVNCKIAYQTALKNDWLGDYWWFERQQNPFTDKMDNVYCYFFTKFNSVYVGRTINPQERDYDHRIRGTVYNFARKNKTEVPEMVLLETNLSLEDGLELEDYYVNKFKKEGCKVLNTAKTGKGSGSLGGLRSSKWTKERCYETAREYKNRSEFAKNCGSAYRVARNNNWLEDYNWFEENKKPNGYWTKERCYEAAREYKNRKEFEKNCGSAYNIARKNNWLSEYDWFEEKKKPSGYWTKERCYEAAREYKNRREFAKNCASGYYTALKNNWLDEFFPEREKKKPKGYWTKEQCYEEACKYKSRSEFRKNCGGGYDAARNNNCLDEFFPEREKSKPSGYWTKEQCYEAAREYKNRSEFKKNCSSAYRVARNNNWLNEYCWFENGYKLASQKRMVWTKERCYEEAIKYISRKEFKKNCGSAYNVAYKNGWLDELFPKNKKSA